MHANFFYKNLVWTGTLFWYCIFNEWEATVSLPDRPDDNAPRVVRCR
jgi:hypothetical protein